MNSAAGVRLAPIITVRQLRTTFGHQLVHDQLDLTIMRGEILALVGSSGAGKTTLLRQLIGLAQPAAGTVEVCGHALQTLTMVQYRQLCRRWGVLFQAGALFSALSVFDNVALPLRELRTLPEDLVHEVVTCRLAMVGLSATDSAKRPADLSGGMVKRAALARALVLDPELLFLDEPTAGLDPQRAEEFVELVRALYRQGRFTVVMVTHDLDTLLALATRVAVLADRRVIVCDTLPNVLKVNHPFIQTFFLGVRGQCALSVWRRGEEHGKP